MMLQPRWLHRAALNSSTYVTRTTVTRLISPYQCEAPPIGSLFLRLDPTSQTLGSVPPTSMTSNLARRKGLVLLDVRPVYLYICTTCCLSAKSKLALRLNCDVMKFWKLPSGW